MKRSEHLQNSAASNLWGAVVLLAIAACLACWAALGWMFNPATGGLIGLLAIALLMVAAARFLEFFRLRRMSKAELEYERDRAIRHDDTTVSI